MKQKTAIEWLIDQLKQYDFADIKDQENYIIKIQSWVLTEKVEQAKEMEKQNLEKFYDHGSLSLLETGHGDTFEKYYNKTFKNK
jgi:hypothetical protein